MLNPKYFFKIIPIIFLPIIVQADEVSDFWCDSIFQVSNCTVIKIDDTEVEKQDKFDKTFAKALNDIGDGSIEPEVEITEIEPEVEITKIEPEVEITEIEPEVKITEIEPEVKIIEIEPEVKIIEIEPEVEITEIEPEVEITEIEPEVEITEIEPEV
ncbi:MAG: hypothetical protein QM487_09385, partial [Candidatus Marithrix sp.]